MTPVKEHKPFVPETADMPEFTFRAMAIGLVMCVVLGAANAYLGLRAGQTIAATYPAAVIGMAILRLFKGSLLEENIARVCETCEHAAEPASSSASFGFSAFHASNVFFQAAYAARASFSRDAKNSRTSGET